MPLSRSREDAALSSERRILRAALSVFTEFGYEGAPTREIARRAKVHQPAIAYHFGNKEKLWRAAVEAVFTEFHATVEEGMKKATPDADRLLHLTTVFIEWAARRPEWFTFILHEGQQTGTRSQWFVETWLSPTTKLLYFLATEAEWPARRSIEMHRAISILAVLSGSTAIFGQRPQILAFSGVDIHSKAFIRQHLLTIYPALEALVRGVAASAIPAKPRRKARVKKTE